MTINDFIARTNGKQFDVDKMYGPQCVDGIAEFCILMKGSHNFTTGTGWAEGLWTKYGSNGVEKYFDRYPYSKAQFGDWIVWDKSKYAPNSHVGMFIQDLGTSVRTYGQSQNGIKAFNYCNLPKTGILGVLRLKGSQTVQKVTNTKNFFNNSKGWYGLGDSSANIDKLSKFMYKTFPTYTDKRALGNYYGPYLKASIKEFQRRTGLETDGNVGMITLKKLEEYGFKY